MNLPEKAVQPTMYFIGVTTTKSSIMKLFPLWAKELGLKDAVIKGIDIEIHAEPEIYRDAVAFIKNDPLSLGALVTTHKIDLYNATKDMFEYHDPHAKRLKSCLPFQKKPEDWKDMQRIRYPADCQWRHSYRKTSGRGIPVKS